MNLTEIYNSRDYLSGESWAEYCNRKGITALDVSQAVQQLSALHYRA